MKRGRLRSETRQTGRPLYYPSFQLVREEAHSFQLVREESHAFQLSFKWARRAIFAPNWSNKLKSKSRTFGAQTQKNGARAPHTQTLLGPISNASNVLFFFVSARARTRRQDGPASPPSPSGEASETPLNAERCGGRRTGRRRKR